MNLFQFLADIFFKYFKNILGTSKLMKMAPKKLYEMFYKNPTEFAKKLGELPTEAKKAFTQEIKKAQVQLMSAPKALKNATMGQIQALETLTKKIATPEDKKIIAERVATSAKGGTDFSLLSSSWLISGEWKSDPTGMVGELTITTKQGASYPYPAVPLITWEAMKKAKGKNGSGAGSVFWVMYLRNFRGSVTHQMLAKAFKLAGIKNKVATPTELTAKLMRGA